jgi:hypothetical protein
MEEIPGLKKWLQDHFGLEILAAQARGHKGDGKEMRERQMGSHLHMSLFSAKYFLTKGKILA